MPTTRSSNRPAPKRSVYPDSDDEDEIVKKPSERGRRGGSKRGLPRGAGRGNGRGRPPKSSTDGKPVAKRGRKKANKSDSEEEDNNVETDHFTDELKKCVTILKEFEKSDYESFTFPFRYPVDAAALGLSDYHEVVKKPMDLATMKKKLFGEEYETAVDFKEDFKLMIGNCLLYNNRSDPVSQLAIQFREAFAKTWSKEFSEDDDDFGKNEKEDGGLSDESDESESNHEKEKGVQDQASSSEAIVDVPGSGSVSAPTSSEAQPAAKTDSHGAEDDIAKNNNESGSNASSTAADSTTEEINT
uniref:Bromo domain-containing protein n=1 Tax=Caenorhabditis japonica TaxID=281687 RepID=A0A8R1DW70_CAEJA